MNKRIEKIRNDYNTLIETGHLHYNSDDIIVALFTTGDTLGTNTSRSSLGNNTSKSCRGSNQCSFLVKYNASGQQQWAFEYNEDGTLFAVVVGQDGSIYATGYTTTTDIRDIIVVKLNSNGVLIWSFQYNATLSNDYPAAIAVDRAQGLYIAGDTDGDLFGDEKGNLDVFLCKLNASSGTMQ